MKILNDFIQSERERFEDRQSNMFAFCFAQIARYYEFVQIIFGRYKEASSNFLDNTKAFQQTLKPGTTTLSQSQTQLRTDGVMLTAILHLEIESFYQFAKILLDKIAHALEFYFGAQRGISLDSHDDLTKNFSKYCQQKDLKVSQELLDFLPNLKKHISDYRDYKIAHEKSPRTIKATVYQGERTRMSVTKIYPTDRDQNEIHEDVETKFLEELENDIQLYITLIIEFVRENSQKTRLTRKKEG